MLFQQMKSNNRMIEAVGVQLPTNQLKEDLSLNSSLIDTPSIAVANYNIQHNSLLHKQSPIDPLLLPANWRIVSQLMSTNKEALSPPASSIKSLLNLHL